MKHVFIVNPVSGKADASLYLVPRLIDAAAGAGVDYAVELTQHAGHAAEIARQYGDDGGPVRLYACGGDGTLNEVFTGAYPYKNAEVASVPCGSGNDFVRNFGAAEDFLSLADNIAGTAVPVDLVAANGGVSAAICSVGLDSEVAYSIPKYRRLPLCGGQMAYNISIVERLLQPMGHRLRITVDDDVLEGDYLIATVCNGVAYGGGFRAAPKADLQDGVLDVIMVKKMSRMRIAGVLSKYKTGSTIKMVVSFRSFRMCWNTAERKGVDRADGWEGCHHKYRRGVHSGGQSFRTSAASGSAVCAAGSAVCAV
ncbi:MAG: diacylglycerol/lipid kinase family protein [Ruthenibacterium lactatiformans]